jgi:peroxiredoxin family protein
MTTELVSPATLEAVLQRLSALEQRAEAAEAKVSELEGRLPKDKLSLVLFSGDLDKSLAAFIIATGAAAMGLEVTMFFTFWGLAAIRRKKDWGGKNVMEAMLQVMSPGSSSELQPSKLAFLGAGSVMLRQMMKQREIASLEELIDLARESGVRMVACGMSQEVMGIRDDELMPGIECGGVAMFIGEAQESKVSLFI